MFLWKFMNMDQLDAEILFTLMRDGRLSAREVARRLGTSHSVINYRIKNMFRSGVFKGFALYINPIAMGFNVIYMTTSKPTSGSCSVSVRLSNGTWIQEIYGGKGFKRIMFNYKETKISDLNLKILNELSLDQKASKREIAERLKVNVRSVSKRIDKMFSSGLVKIVPIIDPQNLPRKLHASLRWRKSDDIETIINLGRIGIHFQERLDEYLEEYTISPAGLEGGVWSIDNFDNNRLDNLLNKDWTSPSSERDLLVL
jgi:Transcriptional regulators